MTMIAILSVTKLVGDRNRAPRVIKDTDLDPTRGEYIRQLADIAVYLDRATASLAQH